MTTEPTIQTPAPLAVSQTVHGIISAYLKAHERMILVVVIGVGLFFAYSKTLGYLSSRDQLAVQKSTQVLQAQIDVNKKIADQTTKDVQTYQQLVLQLSQQNANIQSSQVKRAVQTKQQQVQDAQLPPAELSQRWTTLLKTDPATVQPNPAGYQVTPATATQTVVQLETIPQLQADIQGEQAITANQQQQIASQDIVVTDLHGQVAGLTKQNVDQTAQCVDQIKLVKAEARKSKIKYFLAGVVAGVAITLGIRHL